MRHLKNYVNYKIFESNENQLQKANELYNYINDNLPEDKYDYITTPRTNHSDFGDSTYFSVKTKHMPVEGYKFRISDHSVTNIDRIYNEIHYNYDSNIKRVYNELLDRIKIDTENAEKREKLFNKEKSLQEKVDKFWNEIKNDFKNLQFKRNFRTYQDIKEFNKPHRSNIYQKPLGNNAYYYEWTEKRAENSIGKYKPSNEYIIKYLAPKYNKEFNI